MTFSFGRRVCSLILVVLLGFATAEEPTNDYVDVEMSSKCAAALVGTGALVGAGAAYALTPAAMCSAGFCSAGIAKGSFAAWWQSTMPLVASGSLFAQLQSLTMASAGMGEITFAAGAIGGLTGAAYLKDFCIFVNDTDPESGTGKVIAASVAAGRAIVAGKEFIVDQCAASETCIKTVEAALKGVESASQFAREKANEAREHWESQCDSSELCQAGAEIGTAVKKFFLILWRDIVNESEEGTGEKNSEKS